MSFYAENEIRLYLLGALDDERREQLEDSLLTSDEGLNQIEIAEEELLDDFLTGELDTAELAQFEQHFLRTSVRKQKLEYLRAIRVVAAQSASVAQPKTDNVVPFQAQPQRRPFFREMNRSVYLKLAAAVLLTCTAGFLFWRFELRPAQSEALVVLNRAYASGRTLDVRIGGLDYAPYAPTRGANDTDSTTGILRERASRVLLDAFADQPTAANKHALGKYYLAEKRFDDAIEQFNSALKDTPNVSDLHNDLGAALLEKAKYEKRNNQPGDSLQHMAAALEALQQALKLEPNSPAVIFNRAICLQEMYLPRQAIEEWKKYLQLDPNSAWADEARRRLAELEKAPSNISKSDDQLYQDYLKDSDNDERTFDLFCQSYSTTGNGITERLLDEFLAARQSGDTAKAIQKQQLLERLGALVYHRSTDPYVRDVAHYYGKLAPSLVPKLRQARQHLNDGRQLRSTKQSEAEKQYQAALSLFRQMRDEGEALEATYLLGRLHLRQKNLSKSREFFDVLIYPTNRYLWLRGESLNGIAEFYSSQSLPDEAIRANQSALAIANKISNKNQIVTNAGALAVRYSDLGNWERALDYQTQTLELISRKSTGHQQHWLTYLETAHQLFLARFYSTALTYQQEALNIELKANPKRKLQLSRTYTYLGMMLGSEERFSEALPLVQEAVDIGVSQGIEKGGLEIQAYSGLYLADLQRQAGDLGTALQRYERVIKLNQDLGNAEYDFEAYCGKAMTEIAIGHTEQAKQDLAHALAIFEQSRNQISAEKERMTYVDKEYEAYDAAIGLAFDENPQTAFDLSEKGRARSLLESIKVTATSKHAQTGNGLPVTDRAQPLPLQALQLQIPPQVSILEFTCLPDRLLVFGVSTNGFTQNQITIPLPQLEQKVRAFLRAVSAPPQAHNDQTRMLAAELYQILIEPLEPFWQKSQTICIVPDKVLHHLPFAALFSARQQKYLIENHAIIMAPSASVFVTCLERALHQHTSKNERILIVGNPRFDPSAYPQLSDLTAATREANSVASTYSQHNILTAEQATEEAVKAYLKQATIIHFATHGIIDKRSWANSRLALAKPSATSGEDGALRAYEIAQTPLPKTRLVVLSACQSGVESFYRGEGMIGLGRAFLSAGVPTVVASLWKVDSEITAELMIDFHQQLKNLPASQALRQAQLNFLRNANSQYHNPYYWAAFSTFGGVALS